MRSLHGTAATQRPFSDAQKFADLEVYDESDIGLVEAHAESDSGDQQFDPVVDEQVFEILAIAFNVVQVWSLVDPLNTHCNQA